MFGLRVKVQLQFMNTGLYICYLIKDFVSYDIPMIIKVQILDIEHSLDIFTVLHLGYLPVKTFKIDVCQQLIIVEKLKLTSISDTSFKIIPTVKCF